MNGGMIFLIILLIVVVIVAVVFLILWLTKSATNANNVKELAINNLKVALSSPSTVTATWDSVGNPDDIVTMYASTKPIGLDSGGNLDNDTGILSSGKVSGASKTASISNLVVPAKYFIEVVVTNPKIPGVSNPNSSAIVTGATIPTTEFIISELHTTGAITLSTDNTTVLYVTNPDKSSSDLWTYDSTNFTLKGPSQGGNASPTLYNKAGVLAAFEGDSTTAPLSLANSRWTYTSDNRWCLKSNNTLCFDLATPISGTSSPITVTTNSKPSQWINTPLLQSF